MRIINSQASTGQSKQLQASVGGAPNALPCTSVCCGLTLAVQCSSKHICLAMSAAKKEFKNFLLLFLAFQGLIGAVRSVHAVEAVHCKAQQHPYAKADVRLPAHAAWRQSGHMSAHIYFQSPSTSIPFHNLDRVADKGSKQTCHYLGRHWLPNRSLTHANFLNVPQQAVRLLPHISIRRCTKTGEKTHR